MKYVYYIKTWEGYAVATADSLSAARTAAGHYLGKRRVRLREIYPSVWIAGSSDSLRAGGYDVEIMRVPMSSTKRSR